MNTSEKLLNDYVYYNCIVNNNQSNAVLAKFEEQRDTAILANMENFVVSVVRFQVPTSEVPIFIFKKDAYILRLFDTVTSTYVNNPSNVPPSPDFVVEYNSALVGKRNVSNAIYQYWQFIEMVNTSLNSAISSITPAVAFSPSDIRFELDSGTNKLRLVWLDDPLVVVFLQRYEIHLNYELGYFFNALNTRTSPNNYIILDITANTYSLGAPNIYSLTDSYYYNEAQYSNLYTWHQLRKLIFVTGSMPIQSEMLGSNQIAGGTPASISMITDFEVPPEDNGSLNHSVYFADEKSRRISIHGTGVLKKLDIQIFYQTRDLNLFPLLLAPNAGFEVKLKFERRKDTSIKQY